LGLVFFFMGLTLATAGCSRQDARAQSDAPAAPVEVTLVRARVAHLPVYIQASGTMMADQTVTISAKVAGRVLRVDHDLGDQLGPGQELATIDPTDYKLAIEEKTFAMDQALAQLGLKQMPTGQVNTTNLPTVRRAASQRDNAQARLNRLSQLHTQKLVSDQDFSDAQTAADVARSEYDVAVLNAQAVLAEARTRQAELQTARQRLHDTRIVTPEATAPAVVNQAPSASAPATPSGGDVPQYQVAQRMTSAGEYVREGDPLFQLVDDDPIRLRIAVPERDTAKVRQGQSVQVTVQAFDQPFAGTVTRISPQINPANRTFQVEVSIHNPDHRLKPGGFAMGAIEIESDNSTILVPQAAVSTFAGVSKVFAVAQGKTQEIQVTLGQKVGDDIAISSGLKADSTIISPLPSRTVANMAVKVTTAGAVTTQPSPDVTHAPHQSS
jgi:multidrug efflux pump subunit AcrA (membrane-fusion protein)